MSEPPSSIVLFRRVPAGVRPVALERYARKLRDEVAGGHAYECLITNDREVQRLNLEFRGKDMPTDVLSFPTHLSGQAKPPAPPHHLKLEAMSGPGGAGAFACPNDSLGSLAISWQRAVAQAREHGHTPESELRILMLHGVLHLIGMDHETDRGRMARTESRWRLRLRLPDGLIERAHR